MSYLSNESFKHIIPTILNLKSFDIIYYIYVFENNFDNLSRFFRTILEIGYHLNCDVLNALLEINFDDEEVLEKIISDNIKENKEKVIQILSEYDKEDLIK